MEEIKQAKALNSMMFVKGFFLDFSDIVGGLAEGSYVGHGQTMNSTLHKYKSWMYGEVFWKS